MTASFVAVGVLATTLLAIQAADDRSTDRHDRLEAQADQHVLLIEQRLLSAEHQIRGLEGLFAVGAVDRAAFHRYVGRVDDVAGLKALEFTRSMPTSERESFEQVVQTDTSVVDAGYPGFKVAPDTTYDDMFVVDFVEPMEGNEAAFGFDLGSNSSRRLAIEHARDETEMVASQGINLVQDDQSRFGFLLMRPVYEDRIQPATVEQRRTSFLGVVNGVFIVSELAADIEPTIELTIRDLGHGGTAQAEGEGDLLYSTLPFDDQTTPRSSEPFAIEREITVGDRVWAVEITEAAAQVSSFGTPSNVIVAAGFLLTLAAAVTAFTIMSSRDHAAAAAHDATMELRDQADYLRVARDEAMEADRLKTAFLANMSHELRTPLNAVIGLSSVLANQVFGALSEKQLDYLGRISESGDHLLSLIDDLLDLASIEAGRDQLQLEPVDLGQEINASLEMVRGEVDQNDIAIEGPDPGDTAIVLADRRRLRQILLNLISNAAKFTAEGGRIGVELTHDGGDARIAIWDTGIGITDKEQSKIFEPFHRVDSGLDQPREGFGLGLTLSKRLVEMHGASIHVDSSDEGSQFILTWPLSDREMVTHNGRRALARAPASDLAGCRVLLAEDNDDNRTLIRDLLQLAGCQVNEATDGQAALDKARAEPPDAIVLDIQLPVVDGIKVVQAIRSDSRLSDTPVLAVTALAMAEDVERITAAGCDGYLAKPFTQDDFYAAMDSLLRPSTSLGPRHRVDGISRARVPMG